MKRDLDLVRKILFAMEEEEKRTEFTEHGPLKIKGYKRELTAYHMKIMAQAGLLHVDSFELPRNPQIQIEMPKEYVYYYSISWMGHEFLDVARDDTKWKRAKGDFRKAVGEAGRFVFPVLMQLLTSYLRAELNMP